VKQLSQKSYSKEIWPVIVIKGVAQEVAHVCEIVLEDLEDLEDLVRMP